MAEGDDVAFDLAPEVDVAVFASADDVVEIGGQSGPQVVGFVIVAFYLHYEDSSHHVDESDT